MGIYISPRLGKRKTTKRIATRDIFPGIGTFVDDLAGYCT